jgi:hypothetical protein
MVLQYDHVLVNQGSGAIDVDSLESKTMVELDEA